MENNKINSKYLIAKLKSPSETVVQKALNKVKKILLDEKEQLHLFCIKQGFEIILKLMYTPRYTSLCISILADCSTSPLVKNTLFKEGDAIVKIIKILELLKDEEILARGFRLLANLAHYPDVCALIHKLNGPELIIRTLLNHHDNAKLKISAIRALEKLCDSKPHLRSYFKLKKTDKKENNFLEFIIGFLNKEDEALSKGTLKLLIQMTLNFDSNHIQMISDAHVKEICSYLEHTDKVIVQLSFALLEAMIRSNVQLNLFLPNFVPFLLTHLRVHLDNKCQCGLKHSNMTFVVCAFLKDFNTRLYICQQKGFDLLLNILECRSLAHTHVMILKAIDGLKNISIPFRDVALRLVLILTNILEEDLKLFAFKKEPQRSKYVLGILKHVSKICPKLFLKKQLLSLVAKAISQNFVGKEKGVMVFVNLIEEKVIFEELIRIDLVGFLLTFKHCQLDCYKAAMQTMSEVANSNYGAGTLMNLVKRMDSQSQPASLAMSEIKWNSKFREQIGFSFCNNIKKILSEPTSPYFNQAIRSLKAFLKPKFECPQLLTSFQPCRCNEFTICFQVQDYIIQANKHLLCENSEYFSCLFSSDFMERTQNAILIRNISPEAFKCVLHYLHGCPSQCYLNSNMESMLEAYCIAHMYMLNELILILEKHLPSILTPEQQHSSVLKMAFLYDSQYLQEHFFTRIIACLNYPIMKEVALFEEFPPFFDNYFRKQLL